MKTTSLSTQTSVIYICLVICREMNEILLYKNLIFFNNFYCFFVMCLLNSMFPLAGFMCARAIWCLIGLFPVFPINTRNFGYYTNFLQAMDNLLFYDQYFTSTLAKLNIPEYINQSKVAHKP